MPRRPGLLLYVPGNWDADPPALTELRRHLRDVYGATLEVQQATGPLLAPVPRFIGTWQSTGSDDLHRLIQAAFYSLAWLEREDVG